MNISMKITNSCDIESSPSIPIPIPIDVPVSITTPVSVPQLRFQ